MISFLWRLVLILLVFFLMDYLTHRYKILLDSLRLNWNRDKSIELKKTNELEHTSDVETYEVSRADWWRRWLYSTNAKDIGILYLYFAIFSGIIIMPLVNLAMCWKIKFLFLDFKNKG